MAIRFPDRYNQLPGVERYGKLEIYGDYNVNTQPTEATARAVSFLEKLAAETSYRTSKPTMKGSVITGLLKVSDRQMAYVEDPRSHEIKQVLLPVGNSAFLTVDMPGPNDVNWDDTRMLETFHLLGPHSVDITMGSAEVFDMDYREYLELLNLHVQSSLKIAADGRYAVYDTRLYQPNIDFMKIQRTTQFTANNSRIVTAANFNVGDPRFTSARLTYTREQEGDNQPLASIATEVKGARPGSSLQGQSNRDGTVLGLDLNKSPIIDMTVHDGWNPVLTSKPIGSIAGDLIAYPEQMLPQLAEHTVNAVDTSRLHIQHWQPGEFNPESIMVK